VKFRTYKGETLHDALVTLKIDGVRAHATPQGVMSRAGKPLHNVTLPEGVMVAEIYCGSWEATVSAVRTHNSAPVSQQHVYKLQPEIDERLIEATGDVDAHTVDMIFAAAREEGYEGLVIHAGGLLYKVKGEETYDVEVTGVIPGKGKHTGRMGALVTTMGKVGTGFTDAQRSEHWAPGMVIEVACMEITPGGVFRHARFKRRRFDKE
jgi:hypothetical protein